MAENLAQHASQYIRQHANNTVRWRLWGPAALAEAHERDLPLFVSIGYSSCHWCHVMSRESFSDPEVGAYLNEHFVPVKVDREEHPAVDHAYMRAMLATRGEGGWPLNACCLPDGSPFYLAAYLPPVSADGKIGCLDFLRSVSTAWGSADGRARLELTAERVAKKVADETAAGRRISGEACTQQGLDALLRNLLLSRDTRWGGWGSGAKFPLPLAYQALLRTGVPFAVEAVCADIDMLLASALTDHVGGGFFRYCVDEMWDVPHFEKMLCDNALITSLLAARHNIAPSESSARELAAAASALQEIFAMENGLLTSGIDAESPLPGESESSEGGYYLWHRKALREALDAGNGSAAATAWAEAYNIRAEASYRIDHCTPRRVPGSDYRTPTEVHARLREAQKRRIAPQRSEASVLAWTFLAVAALADAGRSLGDEALTHAGRELYENAFRLHTDASGTLRRLATLAGPAGPAAGLDDLAAGALAAISLGEGAEAARLLRLCDETCRDREGRLRDAASDDPAQLPPAGAAQTDSGAPAGSNSYALAQAKLARLIPEERASRAQAARAALRESGADVTSAPQLYGQWLQAALLLHAMGELNDE
ncbi:thioredoxin domain-containing protein [Dermabacteraceae bacterium P13128]